jgi:hypothetical protein
VLVIGHGIVERWRYVVTGGGGGAEDDERSFWKDSW